jgi:uncharacterized membrane protein YebE (DUF533 family)
MSLVKTLAKVAIGMAVAKGMKSVVGGGGSRSTTNAGSGGGIGDLLGGVLGGQTGGQQTSRAPGGLENIMDNVLGGGNRSNNTGGIGGVVGGSNGSSNAGAGGLGGILDMLGGSAAGGAAAGGLGGLLNKAIQGGGLGDLGQTPAQKEEDAAGLMIRAMLQAAKSDGQVDADEQGKLMKSLGDMDASEQSFIQGELRKPVDVQGLASDVPAGMESQVYMMSLMGIDLDSQVEAQYLHDLGSAMNLSKTDLNQIHDVLNVQPLYS